MISRLAAGALIAMWPGMTAALEQVMVERPGCVWCAIWDSEIAAVHPRTAEGRAAPLVRVDIGAVPAAVELAAPVHFTPTFALLDVHGPEPGG